MTLFASLVSAISDHPGLFLFLRGLIEQDFKTIRELIVGELARDSSAMTLDLGCGPGAFSDLFAAESYVGIDLNERYVRWARRHYPGRFLVSDARYLPLPNESIDHILVFGLLHHLSDEDAAAVLSEMRRILAPQAARVLIIEDIPTVSRLNPLGHLIHWAENGAYIRPVDRYRSLYARCFSIQAERLLRSGLCDYYAAVLSL